MPFFLFCFSCSLHLPIKHGFQTHLLELGSFFFFFGSWFDSLFFLLIMHLFSVTNAVIGEKKTCSRYESYLTIRNNDVDFLKKNIIPTNLCGYAISDSITALLQADQALLSIMLTFT
ncbi:uncharacterized protein EV154DRAFT_555268 [Mucor mucedo]|uniref:uncharacterized protein n=1 Tax=Mucor mucedo TaxID=29922 RepID=UPI00221E414A|nr:uncharacterized protein EV154DRAFT_555268 [Mucor mucedo]KAI7880813.1 hypothetical protein EV154DRAFT_555268 [Mucor mucedo]